VFVPYISPALMASMPALKQLPLTTSSPSSPPTVIPACLAAWMIGMAR
jgi:hypothetical protein